uniref:NADH dehydrogenase subunit 7 n=1 Tax=Diplonema sp. ATCC 50224 TaxID=91375 RepID=A0A2D2AJY7_9EUGL|nr:NADH dehydrogenase subunit 7 [Diplonema sp. ATCC 50224]
MQTRMCTLHFGPAHPAAHGVLRCVMYIRGEWIVGVVMTVGLLHRATEYLLEDRSVWNNVAYMDRLDYVSMLCMEYCFVACCEAMLTIRVTTASSILRIVGAEQARVQNHLLNIACHAGDIGCVTALLYLFEDRELLYDCMSMWTGARMHVCLFVLGGLRCIPSVRMLLSLLDVMTSISIRHALLLNVILCNRVFISRCMLVGVIAALEFIGSGPMLRACGVSWDSRLQDTSYAYTSLAIPVGSTGCSYDRMLVRLMELATSTAVVAMCISASIALSVMLTHGSVSLHSILHGFQQDKSDSLIFGLSCYEAPKGELCVCILEQSAVVWRTYIRPADLLHLLCMQHLTLGLALSDAVMILGTVDVVFGAVDL